MARDRESDGGSDGRDGSSEGADSGAVDAASVPDTDDERVGLPEDGLEDGDLTGATLAAADEAEPSLPHERQGDAEAVVDTADTAIPTGEVRERVTEAAIDHFAADDSPLPDPDPSFVRESFFDFSYLEEYTEVEHYWVNKPYAFVSVLYDEDERERYYRVVEAELDEFEAYVRSDLEAVLRDVLLYQDVDPETDREELFDRRVTELLVDYGGNIDPGVLRKIRYYLTRDFVGYAEVDPIMRDYNVEDISCVGDGVPVFIYHREYRDLETNLRFEAERLSSFVTRLAQRCGQHISVSDPLLDASMPDGSRVQLTLGTDVSTRGSNFTIRKFAEVPYTPIDLVRWNTLSIEELAYLWLAIQNDMSMLVAGGTASGKTTTMNALSMFIPPNSKVVSIEDTREITLPHDNWIQSVSRESATDDERGNIGMYDLLRAGLRQRPEYLLVGEVRTDQDVALTFFQAISTGHTGYTTFHADSVTTAVDRLTNPPLSVPVQMVQAVDVLLVQRQAFLGKRRVRRATEIAEVTRESDEDVGTNRVFAWDASTDTHERVGSPRVYDRIMRARGWDEQRLRTELARRERLLSSLVDQGTTSYEAIAAVFHAFARDADAVMAEVEDGTLVPEAYVGE